MSRVIESYEVFISSPSDVADERQVVIEAIDTINNVRGKRDGFRLEPLVWENDVRPDIGAHPQSIINRQIGNSYDIFVGILCGRFGSKTIDFNSGTEEEFTLALERKRESGNLPLLMFYFKDPRASASPLNGEQFLLVSKFKDSIGKLGVYADFSTRDELKTYLIKHLSDCIDSIRESANGNRQPLTQVKSLNRNEIEPNSTPLISSDDPRAIFYDPLFDDDIGIYELNDIISDGFSILSDRISDLVQVQLTLNTRIQARTAEMVELRESSPEGKVDQKRMKPAIGRMAESLDDFSNGFERIVPQIESKFSITSEAMRRVVIISSEDSFDDLETVIALKRSLSALRETMSENNHHMNSFATSIRRIPRLTSVLNVSKRRAMNCIQLYCNFTSSAIGQIDIVLEHVNESIARRSV